MYYRRPQTLSYFSDSFSSGFSPLIALVYYSVASQSFDDAELEALVSESGENNGELGVTGMLFYFEGAFLQLLEGTEEVVRGLYERIALDPRHQQPTLLLEEYIGERICPEWAMGCRRLSRAELNRLAGLAPGLDKVTDAQEFAAYFQQMPQKAMDLFRNVR